MNNTLQQLENQNEHKITRLKDSELSNVYGGQLLIGTAMDPFHWRRNGPTLFAP